MAISKLTLLGIGLAVWLGPSVLFAQTEWLEAQGGNGHSYQYVPFDAGDETSWGDANAAALEAADGDDYRSYLATVTSSDEYAFIKNLLVGQGLVWLGGYQLPDANERDEGWRWTNNDGAIPGAPGTDPYANWAQNEPSAHALPFLPVGEENAANGTLDRDFLIGDFSTTDAYWYAASVEGENAAIPIPGAGGYIVEYEPIPEEPPPVEEEVGVIIDPQSCKENEGDGSGCATIPEQRLILPASAQIEEGATIVYRAWYLDDPRVNSEGECVGFDPSPPPNE